MQKPELPLRDIHLPAPVSWWPLAPGWWLSLIVLAMLTAALAWWWRGAPSRYARRAGLAELEGIEQQFSRDSDRHACAQGLSRLLRRLALLAGDTQAAHAHGERLQSVLAALGKTPLPPDVMQLLRDAPYSPTAAAAIDADAYRHAIASLRAWLTRMRVPRHAIAKLRHVAV